MRGLRLGIVGSEKAKFTPETESRARALIRALIEKYQPVEVVSGKCPLGGIDDWAVEEAQAQRVSWTPSGRIAIQEYPPEAEQWDPPGKIGYKARNIQIATRSHLVFCLTVAELPEDYDGMRFEGCYHCNTDEHVKSGGCWTVKRAKRMGKYGDVYVIKSDKVLTRDILKSVVHLQ